MDTVELPRAAGTSAPPPRRAMGTHDAIQRARRPRSHVALWAVHRTLGLGVGALILLMSVTGGLLVMHRDLERVLFPERHVVPNATAPHRIEALPTGVPAIPRAPLAPIVQHLASEAPEGYRPLRMETAHAPEEAEKILFVAPDGRTRWAAFVNPYTGAVLWRGPDQALVTPWLLHLHMHLQTGGWGYVVTALGGVCLLLLGVTGLFLYGGRLGAVVRQPMRLGQGWRIAMTDLHRWLGIVSLYFSIVLGLTGAIYTAKTAPGQIGPPKPLGPAYDVWQLAPIEPALAAAARRFPDGEITRVAFPLRANAALVVTVLHRDAPVWRKVSRMAFDPIGGEVRAVHAATDASAREKFAAMLAPLHFGFYGSPLVKWLYVIGGFSPALLALSGTAIWCLRRRKSQLADASPAAGNVLARLGVR